MEDSGDSEFFNLKTEFYVTIIYWTFAWTKASFWCGIELSLLSFHRIKWQSLKQYSAPLLVDKGEPCYNLQEVYRISSTLNFSDFVLVLLEKKVADFNIIYTELLMYKPFLKFYIEVEYGTINNVDWDCQLS